MRRWAIGGCFALTLASLLVAAGAGGATPLGFGAKLTTQSQPANAEGGRSCNEEISGAGACSWVSVQAYQNAGRERAPKTGTIGSVSLVSCVAGSFRLQLVTATPRTRKARLARNGPVIRYRADPRQVDDDDETICGGEDGDDFVVQTYPVNLKVVKGEYIAISAARAGVLYCSGGSGVQLFSPPLAAGGAVRTANGSTSCNLLVRLQYK